MLWRMEKRVGGEAIEDGVKRELGVGSDREEGTKFVLVFYLGRREKGVQNSVSFLKPDKVAIYALF